jgi:hypothetical protein
MTLRKPPGAVPDSSAWAEWLREKLIQEVKRRPDMKLT